MSEIGRLGFDCAKHQSWFPGSIQANCINRIRGLRRACRGSSHGYFSQSIASAEFQAFSCFLRKHCSTLRFETRVFARLSVVHYAAREDERHAKEMDWVLSALSVPFFFRERGKTQPYILDFRLVCKLHSDDLQICSLSMVEINFSITSQASSKLVSERLDIACPCPRPRPRFFHSPLPPYVVV